mgnify:CR=1 FL=1
MQSIFTVRRFLLILDIFLWFGYETTQEKELLLVVRTRKCSVPTLGWCVHQWRGYPPWNSGSIFVQHLAKFLVRNHAFCHYYLYSIKRFIVHIHYLYKIIGAKIRFFLGKTADSCTNFSFFMQNNWFSRQFSLILSIFAPV